MQNDRLQDLISRFDALTTKTRTVLEEIKAIESTGMTRTAVPRTAKRPLAVGDQAKVTGGTKYKGFMVTIVRITPATYVLETENVLTFRKYKNNVKRVENTQA